MRVFHAPVLFFVFFLLLRLLLFISFHCENYDCCLFFFLHFDLMLNERPIDRLSKRVHSLNGLPRRFFFAFIITSGVCVFCFLFLFSLSRSRAVCLCAVRLIMSTKCNHVHVAFYCCMFFSLFSLIIRWNVVHKSSLWLLLLTLFFFSCVRLFFVISLICAGFVCRTQFSLSLSLFRSFTLRLLVLVLFIPFGIFSTLGSSNCVNCNFSFVGSESLYSSFFISYL